MSEERDPLEELRLVVSDLALAEAARQRPRVNPHDIFAIRQPPPGVVPADRKPSLAMDSQIEESAQWAIAGLNLAYLDEGLTFLGYPFLSALAQRPEYRRISEIIAS